MNDIKKGDKAVLIYFVMCVNSIKCVPSLGTRIVNQIFPFTHIVE